MDVGGTSAPRADLDLRGVDVAAGVYDDGDIQMDTPIDGRSTGQRETSGEEREGVDERMERSDELRLAVLIDADNTAAKWADAIFEEIATLGEASVR